MSTPAGSLLPNVGQLIIIFTACVQAICSIEFIKNWGDACAGANISLTGGGCERLH